LFNVRPERRRKTGRSMNIFTQCAKCGKGLGQSCFLGYDEDSLRASIRAIRCDICRVIDARLPELARAIADAIAEKK
jgi:hypothetical protein